ncbi:MAG: hypothetical protein K0Q43_3013 [Ramlibacter sp.]|jgi:hypothetical protein|nr:hypothetical protein [Ramlibacter sp.]
MDPLSKGRARSGNTHEAPAARKPKPDATAAGDAKPRNDVPDLVLLESLTRSIDKLRATGVEEHQWVGAHEFQIPMDVEQDTIEVCKLPKGWALKTSGVGSCYAICAMSTTADGQTLAGISHTSLSVDTGTPQQVAAHQVKLLLKAMADGGAAGPVRLFLAGGQVSLLVKAEQFFVAGDVSMTPAMHVEATVAEGACVIEAAGDLLVSARIGLSETEEYPESVLERDGLRMSPSTGRPQAVSVYVTHDSVFYVAASSDHGEVGVSDEGDEGDEGDVTDEAHEGDLARESAAELSGLRDMQEQPEGLPWLSPLGGPEA